jgi:hypothetical protein
MRFVLDSLASVSVLADIEEYENAFNKSLCCRDIRLARKDYLERILNEMLTQVRAY